MSHSPVTQVVNGELEFKQKFGFKTHVHSHNTKMQLSLLLLNNVGKCLRKSVE